MPQYENDAILITHNSAYQILFRIVKQIEGCLDHLHIYA